MDAIGRMVLHEELLHFAKHVSYEDVCFALKTEAKRNGKIRHLIFETLWHIAGRHHRRSRRIDMKAYLGILILGVMLAVAGTGCQRGDMLNEGLSPSQATSRMMGDTSYQQAYAAGQEVLAQYYSIDPDKSSAGSGVVKSRPKDILDAGRNRLLGNSPARQIATLQIVQEGPAVTALVQVMQQRLGSAPERQMGYSQERRNYNMNPGDVGPGDVEAATTPQQNEMWTNEKRRRDLEGQILDDLYKRLHGN
jgi:hypothetical protein